MAKKYGVDANFFPWEWLLPPLYLCRWVAKDCLLGWHPKHWGCLSLARCFSLSMGHPLVSTRKITWKPYMVRTPSYLHLLLLMIYCFGGNIFLEIPNLTWFDPPMLWQIYSYHPWIEYREQCIPNLGFILVLFWCVNCSAESEEGWLDSVQLVNYGSRIFKFMQTHDRLNVLLSDYCKSWNCSWCNSLLASLDSSILVYFLLLCVHVISCLYSYVKGLY